MLAFFCFQPAYKFRFMGQLKLTCHCETSSQTGCGNLHSIRIIREIATARQGAPRNDNGD